MPQLPIDPRRGIVVTDACPILAAALRTRFVHSGGLWHFSNELSRLRGRRRGTTIGIRPTTFTGRNVATGH